MRPHFTASLIAAAIATLAACGTAGNSGLDRTGSARLDALRDAPDAAGSLIYQGAVYPLQPADAAELFSYERRVMATDAGLSASHITRDANGAVVVVESARFTPAYELQHFEAIHESAGYRGTVDVAESGRLDFTLHEGGKTTKAVENVTDPVVSGPSLHGFILKHWDELASGRPMPVRMIVLAKKETYGFEIRLADSANGRTTFSITPASFVVRLAVDPLHVVFDSSSRNVTRYTGRVLPMQNVNGKLKSLDANVAYTMNVAVYR